MIHRPSTRPRCRSRQALPQHPPGTEMGQEQQHQEQASDIAAGTSSVAASSMPSGTAAQGPTICENLQRRRRVPAPHRAAKMTNPKPEIGAGPRVARTPSSLTQNGAKDNGQPRELQQRFNFPAIRLARAPGTLGNRSRGSRRGMAKPPCPTSLAIASHLPKRSFPSTPAKQNKSRGNWAEATTDWAQKRTSFWRPGKGVANAIGKAAISLTPSNHPHGKPTS